MTIRKKNTGKNATVKNHSTYFHQYRILLPLSSTREAEILLPLADIVVNERKGKLIVLQVVTVPEGKSLSEAATEASSFRQSLDHFFAERNRNVPQIFSMVCPEKEVWQGIWEKVEEENIRLLFIGIPCPALPVTAVRDMKNRRLAEPPCDIIAVRPSPEMAGDDDLKNIKRILLPVRGGPHSAMSLRIAQFLAGATNAAISLLHAIGPDPSYQDERLFSSFSRSLRSLERLTRTITTLGNVTDAIIEESFSHHVIVMGASAPPATPKGWAGPVLHAIQHKINTALIIVKAHNPYAIKHKVPLQYDRPIAVVVDKWFAENTFRSDEFSEIERLIALKKNQGVTISLCLPSLNEEETVGRIIQTIKTELMEKHPLLDEIVLVDSNSEDKTRMIASDMGIPVHIHQKILPMVGANEGKGEALWKSLYVLKGDIIAWIDTDIKNIHPRFVYGILGPLLRNKKIQYVKGFYRRPLKKGDKLISEGGGRVTELTARPLINLFFPELSGLIQPLSGEYAGRRQALERLPFFTGYGVETGLLIDVLTKYGLQAIAQVNLLERVHHNQPLISLSQMSFAIIQVIARRLEDRYKIQLLEEMNKTMNLIHYETKRLYLEAVEIIEHERPPMATLPEYRKKWKLPSNQGAENEEKRNTPGHDPAHHHPAW